MVAAWINPKVINHTILTLIGPQGIYKTTFFRSLLPRSLDRYFLATGIADARAKDDKLAASGFGLIDFEEIDSMKDADLNSIKALVTMEVISERAAYAANRSNRIHVASYCATGNNKTFLTDLTGNRRWLPFEVDNIDHDAISSIPHEQLYAQATHLAKNGWRYWFTREEDLALEEHKADFAQASSELELLMRYYREPRPNEPAKFLSATEILARLTAENHLKISSKKLGQVLRNAGFEQRKVGSKRGYVLVARDYEEISMTQTEEATAALKAAITPREPPSRQLEFNIEN